MPHYHLFAARDGDTIRDSADHPDLESAETWATEVICKAFRLDAGRFDEFWEVSAECDGVDLEEAATHDPGEGRIASVADAAAYVRDAIELLDSCEGVEDIAVEDGQLKVIARGRCFRVTVELIDAEG